MKIIYILIISIIRFHINRTKNNVLLAIPTK